MTTATSPASALRQSTSNRRTSDQGVLRNTEFAPVNSQRRRTIGAEKGAHRQHQVSFQENIPPNSARKMLMTPSKNKTLVSLGSAAASSYYFSDIPKMPLSAALSAKKKPLTLSASKYQDIESEANNTGDYSTVLADTSILSTGGSSSSDESIDMLNRSVLSDTTELTASNFVLAASSRQRLFELTRSKATEQSHKPQPASNLFSNANNRENIMDITTEASGPKKVILNKNQERSPLKSLQNNDMPTSASADPGGRPLVLQESPSISIAAGKSVNGPSPSLRSRVNASPSSARKLTESLRKVRLEREQKLASRLSTNRMSIGSIPSPGAHHAQEVALASLGNRMSMESALSTTGVEEVVVNQSKNRRSSVGTISGLSLLLAPLTPASEMSRTSFSDQSSINNSHLDARGKSLDELFQDLVGDDSAGESDESIDEQLPSTSQPNAQNPGNGGSSTAKQTSPSLSLALPASDEASFSMTPNSHKKLTPSKLSPSPRRILNQNRTVPQPMTTSQDISSPSSPILDASVKAPFSLTPNSHQRLTPSKIEPSPRRIPNPVRVDSPARNTRSGRKASPSQHLASAPSPILDTRTSESNPSPLLLSNSTGVELDELPPSQQDERRETADSSVLKDLFDSTEAESPARNTRSSQRRRSSVSQQASVLELDDSLPSPQNERRETADSSVLKDLFDSMEAESPAGNTRSSQRRRSSVSQQASVLALDDSLPSSQNERRETADSSVLKDLFDSMEAESPAGNTRSSQRRRSSVSQQASVLELDDSPPSSQNERRETADSSVLKDLFDSMEAESPARNTRSSQRRRSSVSQQASVLELDDSSPSSQNERRETADSSVLKGLFDSMEAESPARNTRSSQRRRSSVSQQASVLELDDSSPSSQNERRETADSSVLKGLFDDTETDLDGKRKRQDDKDESRASDYSIVDGTVQETEIVVTRESRSRSSSKRRRSSVSMLGIGQSSEDDRTIDLNDTTAETADINGLFEMTEEFEAVKPAKDLTNKAVIGNTTSLRSPSPVVHRFTPKSILNSALKRNSRTSTGGDTGKRKVAFGSPEAAEYNKGSPSVSLTPMPRNAAKAMFIMPSAQGSGISTNTEFSAVSIAEEQDGQPPVDEQAEDSMTVSNACNNLAESPTTAENDGSKLSHDSSVDSSDSGFIMEDQTVELEGDLIGLVANTFTSPESASTAAPENHTDSSKKILSAGTSPADSVEMTDTAILMSVNSRAGKQITEDETGTFSASGQKLVFEFNRNEKDNTGVLSLDSGSSQDVIYGKTHSEDITEEDITMELEGNISSLVTATAAAPNSSLEEDATVELEVNMSGLFAVTGAGRDSLSRMTQMSQDRAPKPLSSLVPPTKRMSFGERIEVRNESAFTDTIELESNMETILGTVPLVPDNGMPVEEGTCDINQSTMVQTVELEPNMASLLDTAAPTNIICFRETHSDSNASTLVQAVEFEPDLGAALQTIGGHERSSNKLVLSDSPSTIGSVQRGRFSTSSRLSLASAGSRRFSMAPESRLSLSFNESGMVDTSFVDKAEMFGSEDSIIGRRESTGLVSVSAAASLVVDATEKVDLTINEVNAVSGLIINSGDHPLFEAEFDALLHISKSGDLGYPAIEEACNGLLLAVCGEVESKFESSADGETCLNATIESDPDQVLLLQRALRSGEGEEKEAAEEEVKSLAIAVQDFVSYEWKIWENQVAEYMNNSIGASSSDIGDDDGAIDRCATLLDDTHETIALIAGKSVRKARRRSIMRRRTAASEIEDAIKKLENQIQRLKSEKRIVQSEELTAVSLKDAMVECSNADNALSSIQSIAESSQSKYMSIDGLHNWTPIEMNSTKTSFAFIGSSAMSCLEITFTLSKSDVIGTKAFVNPTHFRSRKRSKNMHTKHSSSTLAFVEANAMLMVESVNNSTIRSLPDIASLLQRVGWELGRLENQANELCALQRRYKMVLEDGNMSDDKTFLISVEFSNFKDSAKVRGTFELSKSYPFTPLNVCLDPLEGSVDVDALQKHLIKSVNPGFRYLSRTCDVIAAFLR